MSTQQLFDALEQYRAGLETGLALLRQLKDVAARQQERTEQRDFVRLAADSDERDRLTGALVAIEPGLRAVRDIVLKHHDAAIRLPAYQQIIDLRQNAADLVNGILKTDEASMRSLSDAELARRAAATCLEQGEATLAAYRRVLTPTVGSASFLDIRG
jgi:hypothetical protein